MVTRFSQHRRLFDIIAGGKVSIKAFDHVIEYQSNRGLVLAYFRH